MANVSLGTGIGLGGRYGADRIADTVDRNLRYYGALKGAQKKEKPTDYATISDDFKIDYSKWTSPAYAREAAETIKKVYDTYGSMVYDKNDPNALNKVSILVDAAKKRIGELQDADLSIKAYKEAEPDAHAKGGYYKEDEFLTTALSPDASIKDVATIAAKYRDKGIQLDENGVGRIMTTPVFTPDIAFTDKDYTPTQRGTPRNAGYGQAEFMYENVLNPESRLTAYNQLINDAALKRDVLYHMNPNEATPENIEVAVRSKANEILDKYSVNGRKYELRSIPNPTEGDKERARRGEGQYDVPVQKEKGNATYRYYNPFSSTPITVTRTDNVLDAFSEKPLHKVAPDTPLTLTLKNAAVYASRQGDKYVPYVTGEVTEYSEKDRESMKLDLWRNKFKDANPTLGGVIKLESEEGKKYEPTPDEVSEALLQTNKPYKTRTIEVPLSEVEGGVKGVNFDVDKKAIERLNQQLKTEKPKAEAKTGEMVSVTIDGKTGKIPKSNLAAFKKKYPKAIVQ